MRRDATTRDDDRSPPKSSRARNIRRVRARRGVLGGRERARVGETEGRRALEMLDRTQARERTRAGAAGTGTVRGEACVDSDERSRERADEDARGIRSWRTSARWLRRERKE